MKLESVCIDWTNTTRNLLTTGTGTFASLDITDEATGYQVDGASFLRWYGTNNLILGKGAGAALEAGGTYNVLFGDDAGAAITTGDNTVAIGYQAAYTQTTINDTIAIGYKALYANTTDSGFELAIGTEALAANTSGSYNTGIGYQALYTNTTGYNNFALGATAFYSNTEGFWNVGLGVSAGYSNTDGDYNTYIGGEAGYYNEEGSFNVCIGGLAGKGATGQNFSSLMAIGYKAASPVTTGSGTYIGTRAGETLTSGANNVCIGYYALNKLTTGRYNVCVGDYAGRYLVAHSTANENCLFGFKAGQGASSGGGTFRYNVYIGSNAGADVTTGDSNVCIGWHSAFILSSGGSNIFLGNGSGATQTTLSNLLIVDNQARANPATDITNALLYGVMAAAPADQSLRINGEILGSDGGKIGDVSTNNTVFATDGLQTMVGTARVLREMWIDAGGIKAPGSKPATAIAHGALETPAWQFGNEAVQANEETVSFNLKMPPDMDRSVAPIVCLGWSATATSGVVEWQLEYLYTQLNEATNAAAEETLYADDSVSGTAEGLVRSEFIGINTPDANDVCMHCRVKRLSSATANGGAESDTLADDAELHGVVFVYTSNKLGTGL